MNLSRKDFFTLLGSGVAAATLPGCVCPTTCGCGSKRAKIALQLYSLNGYIPSLKIADTGKVDLARAFENIAAIGFKGVEFAGYYQYSAKELRSFLQNAGLKACGTHVSNDAYGFDFKTGKIDADKMKKTCEFNLGYGNNLIICPGGGNIPPNVSWSTGQGGSVVEPSQAIDDFTKRLVDFYNEGALLAAKFGCRIGIHNHTWEHGIRMLNGISFWDYFFSNTSENVCMEQDVGWSTCAGVDPKAQYRKYPHRSPTLHAKENGMAPEVKEFDAILGKPGKPGAVPVDWDGLIPVTEKDGVEWYVVECERHFDDLSSVLPSYNFLKSKGLT